MSPQVAADIVHLVDEFSPARRPASPAVWRGCRLAVGDVCTVRHLFRGPVSLTVRTWGVTRDGEMWVAGNRRSALVSDILIVERDVERLQ